MKIDYATATEDQIAAARAIAPRVFGRMTSKKLNLWGQRIAFIGFVTFCLWYLEFSPQRIWEGLDKLGWMLSFLFPPTPGDNLSEILYAMLETLAMAFFGTLLASLAALPLGFLGAKNVIPTWLFHFLVRRFFDGVRSIDSLIWALIFVSIIGLGPFAGVLALAVSETGSLAKLFAEAIENVEHEQVEGVQASGGNRIQIMRFAIMPQVLPIMLSNVLYYFESNTRSATIIGIVGAGGIGLQLANRIRVNIWDEVCFIIIIILVAVTVIDMISKEIRLRIINDPEYRP